MSIPVPHAVRPAMFLLAQALAVGSVIPAYAGTLTVTTSADSGAGSLRDAIASAAAGDTITFDGDHVIVLASELVLDKSLTIDGSGHAITLSGNHTVRIMKVAGGTVTLNQLRMVDGYFAGPAVTFDGGGAILTSGGNVSATDCTFSGNAAVWPGGGAVQAISNSSATFTNCAFISNSAVNGGYGGAIGSIYQNTVTAINCTFSGNTASSSGGAISIGDKAFIINCTLSGNTCGWNDCGGGINNEGGSITVHNTVITNCGSARSYWDHAPFQSKLVASNNLTDDNPATEGFTQSNAILLGPLGQYGGPTQTFPLLPGSSAIKGTTTNAPATDQRGVVRAAPASDIGAFESRGFTFGDLTGTPQTVPGGTAFGPIGLTISSANGEPVAGGVVTFTAPSTGATATMVPAKATIDATGKASTLPTAGYLVGTYAVTASAGGTTADFILTNTPPAPEVSTAAASAITGTTATLNGTVNVHGYTRTLSFEYGDTSSYGATAAATPGTVSDMSNLPVSAAITGLTPNSPYHYRIVCDSFYGPDQSFTTAAVAPAVTTGAATGITPRGATLAGTVNARNASTTVSFEYGTTPALGSTVTATPSPVTGLADTPVSATLAVLQPLTTYYYRVSGSNAGGTSPGATLTFTTEAAAPVVSTGAALDITPGGATLTGMVDALNGSTTVTFEYGPTPALGNSVTATPSPVTGMGDTAVSAALSGLEPVTLYYYRVSGVNAGGTTLGPTMTFTTAAAAPVVSTGAATGITPQEATLTGTVNARNASTVVTFEYGPTAAFGYWATAAPSPVTGTTDTAVSVSLSGLAPLTRYFYRVKGVNAGGTTPGATLEFTTLARTQVLVQTLAPSHGAVGTAVTLTGSGFTQASSVVIGGMEAMFTVVSDTEITCVVPPGAVTGPIQVTSPAGTGSSATFTVDQEG